MKEKKKMTYAQKRSFWGILFLLPWAIGILVFFLGPLVRTFYYSFFEMELATGGFSYKFTGLGNYKYALRVDPAFNQKLLAALTETLRNVPIQIFVSLFVAMLLNGEYKGKGFFRLIFFVPIILATGITKLELADITLAKEASESFVNTAGVTNILNSSGIPSVFINYIMVFVNDIFDVITTAGVQMLIFLSGLQSISPSLYEVAKIEGCSQFECFCKITLPMISPMILVCMIYSLADSFARADISKMISTTTFTNAQYGLGAAMSAVYFLVSIFVILVLSAIVSKGVFYYDK
jgi:ABC-type sugar transport system permease subunit